MLSTNIAHGHLFAGRWDDAEKVYRQFRAAKVDDKRTFAQATLEDFAEFRKEGLTHPDMEKVEKLLAE
jgi:hypothetical protein